MEHLNFFVITVDYSNVSWEPDQPEVIAGFEQLKVCVQFGDNSDFGSVKVYNFRNTTASPQSHSFSKNAPPEVKNFDFPPVTEEIPSKYDIECVFESDPTKKIVIDPVVVLKPPYPGGGGEAGQA